MDITYDPAKNERNISERGLSFERAADFDFETAIFWVDTRRDYGEVRQLGLGYLEYRLHVMCFTEVLVAFASSASDGRTQGKQSDMRRRKPLIDDDGEVRELLLEDIKQFRPAREALSPSLLAKLGIEGSQQATSKQVVSLEKAQATPSKRRKSGIPTGNAGEYFVMGELLKRGFDAQLADRNTKDYDLLVGLPEERKLRKVQVKSVRTQPWYINIQDFGGSALERVTVYVLIGSERSTSPVRYFIARNRDLAGHVHRPSGWVKHGFMNIKALEKYENRWDLVTSED